METLSTTASKVNYIESLKNNYANHVIYLFLSFLLFFRPELEYKRDADHKADKRENLPLGKAESILIL